MITCLNTSVRINFEFWLVWILFRRLEIDERLVERFTLIEWVSLGEVGEDKSFMEVKPQGALKSFHRG